MIERYSRKEMSDIWSEESKFNAFLKVEIANVEALNEKGIVSDDDVKKIKDNASFDIQRIKELEKDLKHDVIAFTRAVSESLGGEKRYIHYGLTSTDVVDTANGYLLKRANKIIVEDIENFLKVLKAKAYLYQSTYCIGRTHGIHADITVFGLKFALWYDELKRNYQRFLQAASQIEYGKISGAVGNYAFVDPSIEAFICKRLGLGVPNISTQILQRDRHANYINALVLLSSTIEKIALEIRHLQRTEIDEVREPFGDKQKGSSAMPHKRNPIVSENMCGIARILRGYLLSSLENIALWHERDISHSSVERIILPDATTLIDYMFTRYIDIIDNLVVFPEKMLDNIYLTKGIIFSQRILTDLIDRGLTREAAYDLIQPLAAKAYEEDSDFIELVKNDESMRKVYQNEDIDFLFDLKFYKRNVDKIFEKVF